MEQGYSGFSIHCGGSITIYNEHKWIEWDKRTPRIIWMSKKRQEHKKIKKIKKIENL